MFKFVIVEGNIGAGKTSLTEELALALGDGTIAMLEPDEKGRRLLYTIEGRLVLAAPPTPLGGTSGEGRNPYLDRYYADPPRWAFTLQIHQLHNRARYAKLAQDHVLARAGYALNDRSYQGDTAFAYLQRDLGYMTEEEFDTYAMAYQTITTGIMLPSVMIRILTTPEVCAERIMKRMEAQTGRRCEEAVDLDYLYGLEREIDRMAAVMGEQGVKVIEVEWDADRHSSAMRAAAVDALASRIRSLRVAEPFLEMHRRRVI